MVGYTQQDIDTWADLMARSIRAAGGRAGDICHVAYGYGLFTGGLGAHYGAEPWTEQMRTEVEQRTAMHAVDIYGLSDVMGPGVAQECVESKDGLHSRTTVSLAPRSSTRSPARSCPTAPRANWSSPP